MASEAQIRANRENAKRSTGPTSSSGRAASSQNAVKHRMFALTPVAGPEDEQEFTLFIQSLLVQYAPETDMEYDLIHQMADARWRYLRACEEERALYNLDFRKFGAQDPAAYDRGEAFIRLMDAKHLQYSRRCQRSFERKYEKSLAELRRLQAQRTRESEEEESIEQAEVRTIAESFPGMSRDQAMAEMAAWHSRVTGQQSQSDANKIGFVPAKTGITGEEKSR